MNVIESLKPFWIPIIRYGTIILGVLLVLFKARQSGKDAVKNNMIEKTLQGIKTHEKIADNINSLDNATVNKLYEQELKRD